MEISPRDFHGIRFAWPILEISPLRNVNGMATRGKDALDLFAINKGLLKKAASGVLRSSET
jgi:hypothetical protein